MERFGPAMRRCRLAKGWSLRKLAAVSGLDFGFLGQIERGRRRCSPDNAEIIDLALGADGELFGLYLTSSPRRKQVAGGREDDETMRRRTLIGVMGTLAADTAVGAAVGLEALRQSLDLAADTDRDQWQQIADGYATDFYLTPPTKLVDRLNADLTVLRHQMVAWPDDPDLLRAAGQLSMVLAITLTSSGEAWLARRWWESARVHADRSGDLALRVMVRSQDGVKGLYDGRPLSAALTLTQEAIGIAGSSICPGSAGALAGGAQALALLGRHEEARSIVEELETVTERMPGGPRTDAESMFGWPEHRLRHTQSYVYTSVGNLRRAMLAQDQARVLYARVPAQAGNAAMVEMHRAVCMINDRDIAGGLRHAADVLDGLPALHHDQLLYEVARQVVAALPGRQAHRPDADHLRERLRALPAR